MAARRFPALALLVACLGCGGGLGMDGEDGGGTPPADELVGPVDWPYFRGANLDGITPENLIDPARLADGVEPAWTADIGVGYASVAVVDGTVYAFGFEPDDQLETSDEFPSGNPMTGGDAGREVLRGLDLATGRELWRHAYEADRGRDTHHAGGPSSTPAVLPQFGGRRVVAIGKTGRLVDLDVARPGVDRFEVAVRHDLDLAEATGLPVPMWGAGSSAVPISHYCGPVLRGGDGDPSTPDGTCADTLLFAFGGRIWTLSRGGEPEAFSDPHVAGYGTPVPFPTAAEMEGEIVRADQGRKLALYASDGLIFSQIYGWVDGERHFEAFPTNAFECAAASPVVRTYYYEPDGPVRRADYYRADLFVTGGVGTGGLMLTYDPTHDTLTRRYFTRELSSHFATPVRVGESLFGCDGHSANPRTAELVCLDWETGELNWKQRGLGLLQIIVAGDLLVMLNDTGTLILAEVSDTEYREVSRAKILDGQCWTMPVVSHGRVLARNSAGRLVCYDLRSEAAVRLSDELDRSDEIATEAGSGERD